MARETKEEWAKRVEGVAKERAEVEMGFREEPKGANVWLVMPNDEGLFVGARKRMESSASTPVQAYLDLQAHATRMLRPTPGAPSATCSTSS
jgi:hypothetical protein